MYVSSLPISPAAAAANMTRSMLLKHAHALAKSLLEGSYRQRLSEALRASWYALKNPSVGNLLVSAGFVKKLVTATRLSRGGAGESIGINNYRYSLNAVERVFLNAYAAQPELAKQIREDEYLTFANGKRNLLKSADRYSKDEILEIRDDHKALYFRQSSLGKWHRMSRML